MQGLHFHPFKQTMVKTLISCSETLLMDLFEEKLMFSKLGPRPPVENPDLTVVVCVLCLSEQTCPLLSASDVSFECVNTC